MKDIINNYSERDIDGTKEDGGFTLVEILIAIVLVGILSAVVVVGISNLTSKGNTSACSASLDAAKAGSVVYYATNGNTYPTTLDAMTKPTTFGTPPAAVPAALTLPSGVKIDAATAPLVATTGTGGWTLTMAPGTGGAAPTFVCT